MKNRIISLMAALALLMPFNGSIQAMQSVASSTKGHNSVKNIIEEIAAKSNQIIDFANTRTKAKVNGWQNELTPVRAQEQLATAIAALPASMKELKDTLIAFARNADALDEAHFDTHLPVLVKSFTNSGRILQEAIKKARMIVELTDTMQEQAPAKLEVVDARQTILKELAHALNADVEKIVTFDVRSKKVPGALALGDSLRPFVNKLNGPLAELKEPLRTYIHISRAFDNAGDTELMETVSTVVEYLSELIGYYRGFAEVKPSLDATTETHVKSILVKEGSKKEPKENKHVTFAADTKPAQENAPAPVAAQHRTTAPYLLSPKEINALAQRYQIPVVRPVPVKSQPVVSSRKNTIVAAATVAAPLAVAGLAAAYNAGYITMPSMPSVNGAFANNAMSFMNNAAQTIGGQLVSAKQAISRNLGSLGVAQNAQNLYRAFVAPTVNFAAPYQTPILASAGAASAGLFGYRWLGNSPAPKNNPTQPGVTIEEVDANNRVIAALKPVALAKKKGTLITKRKVIAAAAVPALAAAGYAAYNYFKPVNTTVEAPIVSAQPEIMSSVASSGVTALDNAATNITHASASAAPAVMGRGIYQWLTGNALEPWL